MVFIPLTNISKAVVDVTCDTAEALIGEGDGPKRSDVAQLLAAGMTVGAIAVALDLSEDIISEIASESGEG